MDAVGRGKGRYTVWTPSIVIGKGQFSKYSKYLCSVAIFVPPPKKVKDAATTPMKQQDAGGPRLIFEHAQIFSVLIASWPTTQWGCREIAMVVEDTRQERGERHRN